MVNTVGARGKRWTSLSHAGKRIIVRPPYATRWDSLASNPNDFPFKAADVNTLLNTLDNAFNALELAGLVSDFERIRVNIDECLDGADQAFISFNKVVAEANEQKKKWIGLAMKIVGGGLSAVGGPLGGLLGNLLVEGAQHVIKIAIDAASVSAKATELSKTAAEKATSFIEEKLQKKLFIVPESDASLFDLKTKIRRLFPELVDDVIKALKHGINEVTGVVKVDRPPLTDPQRRSATMDLLWTVFDKNLKAVTDDFLVAATQAHVTELTNDVTAAVLGSFKLNHFQFADKSDLKRYFELRYLARLTLDLAAQSKDPPGAVVDAFVRLNIVGKWAKGYGFIGKSSDQMRAEILAAGKIRIGTHHVSEREKLMLRMMCKYIDQRVQPMDVALGRRRAADIDAAIQKYAKDVTDYVERMKREGRGSDVTAEKLEQLGDPLYGGSAP